MVEQLQKQEKGYVQLLKKKKTHLSSQVMAPFLLVLILGTSTMSCSLVPPKVECGFSNQSVEDLDRLKIKLWSDYLMCRITLATSQGRILPIDILQKD